MRIRLSLTILALFILAFVSEVSAEYIDDVGLFTKDEFILKPISNTIDILEKFQVENPEKNIIIYIHGRNYKTNKEWANLNFLEKKFNAKILMFHWRSWGGSVLVRPTKEAAEAATDLSVFLKQIKDYKESNPDIFINKKIALLVHSMGNVVFKEYMEKLYQGDLNNENGGPLFNTFISAAPDVGLTDHKAWFSNIDFAEKKFVTVNNHDRVLALSYLLDLKALKPKFYKLGLGFRNLLISDKSIVKLTLPDVDYIDLSKVLRSEHRYFESNNELMTTVFKPLLNGEKFNPNSLGLKYKMINNNIFYIND